MRVLFISGELIAGDVAYRLKQEGCEVKLYIEDQSRADCFDNMLEKTEDWRKELDWVGKDGLIVFDDVGYGEIQDNLRKDGYIVFGGCNAGDRLEKDREFAQQIFKRCGIETKEVKNFEGAKDAIEHIKRFPDKWVVKQNAHLGSMSYVGSMPDGSDVISLMKSYQGYTKNNFTSVLSLQKRIDGVEVAVGRFFNGSDWNSPTLINFEHKPFLYNNIGPLTAEMGTLAWYDDNEDNELFQATLSKIKPYLQDVNFRGYVDINSIVNKKTIFPLEATMRLGSPTNHMQSEMHLSHWVDFLLANAKGEKFQLKYKPGYSIVVSIAIPPFPYNAIALDYIKGVDIFFKEKLSSEEWTRIHFEEVSKRSNSDEMQLHIAGQNGYILFITGTGETVEKARQQVYGLIDKIVIPKMMYRPDIGVKFIEHDQKLLQEWGWIE